MARYGRDFGAGYPARGGMGRYDQFHRGPGRAGGWSGRPGMGEWGPYGAGRGGGGFDLDFEPRGGGYGGEFRGNMESRRPARFRGRTLDPRTGETWAGESAADQVQAADIMTVNPEAVTPDTKLSEVASRMRELDVGIIPVVDDLDSFRLQGVITDRDITIRAAAEGKDMSQEKVSDFMTSDVQTVQETDHVRNVFTVMKRARVRRVPVTDEEGTLVGIIAQADLAVNYAGLDLQRETEVEEVIERISEPARPNWGGRDWAHGPRRYAAGGQSRGEAFPMEDLGERFRDGWEWVRRETRQLMGRGYDRGYDRGFRR